LHLFGHVHQDGGFWQRGNTTSVNVTTWEGERRATVLDLDPERRIVTPIEVPEAGP
jgi:Icc-related predicted phosphoesterase